MNVVSAQFTGPEQMMLRVFFADGTSRDLPWPYLGGTFREELAEWMSAGGTPTESVPLPPDIPALTRRQARLGLLTIGITAADVEARIDLIADPIDRAAALIEWQDAGSYDRNHPLVVDLAEAFALPASQVDALWTWAADQF